MAFKLTDEGIEDDGRNSPKEIYEFIYETSEDFADLLKFISHHENFGLEEFQVILDAVYTYAKHKRSE